MKVGDSMQYMWLIISIILGVVEILTVNLTTIWFVVSALVALFVSFFIDNFLIEMSIFVILGIILLITTRPLLNKLIKVKKENTNLDRVIGMVGIVTEDINKNSIGEVKVDGKRWSAISDKGIKKDTNVKILEVNGVKLKVEEE